MPGSSFHVFPAVIGAEHSAFVVVEQAPSRYIDRGRVRRVKDDVIEDIVTAYGEVGEQLPGSSTVIGREHLTRAGAEQDVPRVARVISQTANIAAIGTDHPPVSRDRTTYRRREEYKDYAKLFKSSTRHQYFLQLLNDKHHRQSCL